MDAKNITYKNGDKISYDEYLKIAENNNIKCEYLDGKIYFMTPPSIYHTLITDNLTEIIFEYLKNKKCKVYNEKMALYYYDEYNNERYVYPDLFILCDKENIKNGKYFGKPKLVIEVLSTNRKTDLKYKMKLYEKIGVEEYYIVNQYTNSVTIYELQKCNNKGIVYAYNSILESKIYKNLKFELNKIFDYSFIEE